MACVIGNMHETPAIDCSDLDSDYELEQRIAADMRARSTKDIGMDIRAKFFNLNAKTGTFDSKPARSTPQPPKQPLTLKEYWSRRRNTITVDPSDQHHRLQRKVTPKVQHRIMRKPPPPPTIEMNRSRYFRPTYDRYGQEIYLSKPVFRGYEINVEGTFLAMTKSKKRAEEPKAQETQSPKPSSNPPPKPLSPIITNSHNLQPIQHSVPPPVPQYQQSEQVETPIPIPPPEPVVKKPYVKNQKKKSKKNKRKKRKRKANRV